MTKIIFLDIDGPMIPGRAYLLPRYPENYEGMLAGVVTEFDPIAVEMINNVCEDGGWKIVLHSSWIRIIGGQKTYEHCIRQGISSLHFHEDKCCDEREPWRYTRVAKWLKEHPEVQEYVIIDDMLYGRDDHSLHPKDMKDHVLNVDFEDGLLSRHYRKLYDGAWAIKIRTEVDYGLV